MLSQAANINFYFILGADIGLFITAHFFAYLLRFEFSLTSAQFANFILLLPWIVAIKALTFFAFGLYRGMWRYAGVGDMWRLFKAVVFSGLVINFIILFVHRFQGYSRAVFLLDPGLTFLLCGGLRMAIRMVFQKHQATDGKGIRGMFGRRRAGRRCGWRWRMKILSRGRYGNLCICSLCLIVDYPKTHTDIHRQRKEFRPGWFGGKVAEDLFERGLCLPSGTAMTNGEVVGWRLAVQGGDRVVSKSSLSPIYRPFRP